MKKQKRSIHKLESTLTSRHEGSKPSEGRGKNLAYKVRKFLHSPQNGTARDNVRYNFNKLVNKLKNTQSL